MMFCIPSFQMWFLFPSCNDVLYYHIAKIIDVDGDNKDIYKGFSQLNTCLLAVSSIADKDTIRLHELVRSM